MADLLHTYTNGNYIVALFKDGTKQRFTEAEAFEPVFPENIDIKISDKCKMGCDYCHEGSTPDGNVALFNQEFLYSLRPGTELAIGGGNVFSNPNLKDFLHFCKIRGIVANITVSQKQFDRYGWSIISLIDRNLIHGVGISFNGDAEEFAKIADYHELHSEFDEFDEPFDDVYLDHMVIHVINGVHTYEQLKPLMNKGYKLLILGYKTVGRGVAYFEANKDTIAANQQGIYDNIHAIMKGFKVVSFDNLAIEQLNMQRLFTSEEWASLYMGDEGQFTMYIDLVKNEFAMNSTSQERYPLMDTVDDMFNYVQKIRR